MPRDVVTIEEEVDEDSVDEPMESGSEDDGPESSLPAVDAGATVNFMHDPVRKRVQEQKRIKNKKKLTKKEETSKRKLAAERILMALVKPDAATDREKERHLRRIATKGVVQLFNAVAERQRTMSKTLQQKMTAKERKEATEHFRGSQFDVYGKEVKEENEDGRVKKEEDEEGDLSD